MNQDQFMPVLFKVLFGFVLLNMLINFILLMVHRRRIHKLLSAFWPSVLVVFLLQASLQSDPFHVALAYGATFVPMIIIGIIGFEALGRETPLKNYLLIALFSYATTIFLYLQGYPFTIYTLPLAIATAVPLAHTSYYLLYKDRKKSSRLQKLLGVLIGLMPIHCINFAIFRMEPGSQLWGWLVAYALYDALAVLFPSISLEKAKIQENDKLQMLVTEKTAKLRQTLKENDSLLKVLIHDIANPLMVMKYYAEKLTPHQSDKESFIRLNKSLLAIEEIILQVKERYMLKKNQIKVPLKPVMLDECFDEVSFIFAQSLQKKKISLKFINHLPAHSKVMADKASLVHSVLSNLVSNGVKFSASHTQIEVSARENSGIVILEVKDQGPGIPQDVIDKLMSDADLVSSEGTDGEQGSGFGLSIAKSFVDSYGGEIEFESKSFTHFPTDHGTNIKISLDLA